MFKIHENADGSTSIFCNKTGKLICKIGGQQKKMGLGCRPVSVVETTSRPSSCCYNLDLKSNCVPDVECLSIVEVPNTSSKDDNSDDERKEDFSEECITPEEFARCLNLVPKEKLKDECTEQLRTTFPLRLISRTKKVSDDISDVKIYDFMGITSNLGFKMLELNKQKNFCSDQNIEMKIKQYDSFCRFQINTAMGSNFPKLRCRDRKDYPVCTILRNSESTHMYALTKRQRLEKMLTFKTGLDTHSRRLLRRCNKRLAVQIKRLTPEEIDKWPHKSSKIGPILADYIVDQPSYTSSYSKAIVAKPNSAVCTVIDLFSSDSPEPSDDDDPSVKYPLSKIATSVLNSSSTKLSPLKNKNRQCSKVLSKPKRYKNRDELNNLLRNKPRDCCVVLNNVLSGIQRRRFDNYFVAGTRIRVPFYKDFLSSLKQKVHTGNFDPISTSDKSNCCHDHSYHILFPQETYRRNSLNPNCLNQKTTPRIKGLLKESNCVRSKDSPNVKLNCGSNSYKPLANKPVAGLECIPIIDLTNDAASTPTVKVSVRNEGNNVSNYKFLCYGCGFKKLSMRQSAAYALATQHMNNFHCVSDIKTFLNVNNTQSGTTLEAFPGYKSSLVD